MQLLYAFKSSCNWTRVFKSKNLLALLHFLLANSISLTFSGINVDHSKEIL